MTLGKHVKELTKLVKKLQDKVRTYEEREFNYILEEAQETLNQGATSSTPTRRTVSFASQKKNKILIVDTPPTSPVPINKEKRTWESKFSRGGLPVRTFPVSIKKEKGVWGSQVALTDSPVPPPFNQSRNHTTPPVRGTNRPMNPYIKKNQYVKKRTLFSDV